MTTPKTGFGWIVASLVIATSSLMFAQDGAFPRRATRTLITDTSADPSPGCDVRLSSPGTVATTTVQDPKHPDEPWTISSTKGPDESIHDFLMRHRKTVMEARAVIALGDE